MDSSLFWISLSLEAVPHGGAKCTYTQAPFVMRSLTNCKWYGCNKSSLTIGPFKRVGMVQSMPTLSTNSSRLSAWLFQRKFLMQKLGWSAVLVMTSLWWNYSRWSSVVLKRVGFETPRLCAQMDAFGTAFAGFCIAATVGQIERPAKSLFLGRLQRFVD